MSLKIIALMLSFLALLVLSAVAQEDIFNVNNNTGMTPGVASKDSGVRTALAGSLANIAGGWTLSLDNAGTKSLKLALYQNNNAIFGSGDITVLGNTTPVSAGGTLQGNSLMLYVIPSGEPSLYMIDTMVGPGSITGSYVFSTQAATQQRGSVSGSLTEASMSTPHNNQKCCNYNPGWCWSDKCTKAPGTERNSRLMECDIPV